MNGDWRYIVADKSIEITIEQTENHGYLFATDIGVGIYSADSATPAVHRLNLSGRRTTATIPLDTVPSRVVLDPNTQLLAKWSFDRIEE